MTENKVEYKPIFVCQQCRVCSVVEAEKCEDCGGAMEEAKIDEESLPFGEISEMNNLELEEFAIRELQTHNLPHNFSYRRAFLLGFNEALKTKS